MPGVTGLRAYLDNNATTMVDPRVVSAMAPFWGTFYGNPNSLHRAGSSINPHLSRALDRMYAALCAKNSSAIVVNSGASEGNNHAIKGTYWTMRGSKRNQYITTVVEHPSVSNTFQWLSKQPDTEVVYLPVNKDGIVCEETLRKYMDPARVALVSVMWANNETGLIMPVQKLAQTTKEAGGLFHTDATQAVGKIAVDASQVPADFITFSGHKFHGPKGVGGLYIREGVRLATLIDGGEQMGRLRGGTVNVPGFVGMGLAMEIAHNSLAEENTKVRALRDWLEDFILKHVENSSVLGSRNLRTPNTIFATFRGVEGEAMLWDLDQRGIAASTGSACASESLEASPALSAMSLGPELAHTGVRFSLSRFTTRKEVKYAAHAVRDATQRLRSISGFSQKS